MWSIRITIGINVIIPILKKRNFIRISVTAGYIFAMEARVVCNISIHRNKSEYIGKTWNVSGYVIRHEVLMIARGCVSMTMRIVIRYSRRRGAVRTTTNSDHLPVVRVVFWQLGIHYAPLSAFNHRKPIDGIPKKRVTWISCGNELQWNLRYRNLSLISICLPRKMEKSDSSINLNAYLNFLFRRLIRSIC